jgi:hypothetical protein
MLARRITLRDVDALRRPTPACLQREQIDLAAVERLQVRQPHLGERRRRDSDLKPRLGRRRCSGIWPPSKPTLWKPPARDFWPLWPRPARLAQARADAAADAPLRACSRPSAGLIVVQFHRAASPRPSTR